MRPFYNGTIVANDGLNPETAAKNIANGDYDLASFGILSIGNPDLPVRVKNGWKIN